MALAGMMAVSMFGCGASAKKVEVTSAADLADLTVGVQTGTTGDLYVSDDAELSCTVERFNKGFEAVQALLQGKVDAVVIDDQPAQVFVSENKINSDKSIPRENLQRTQTPQSYYLGELWNAHVQAKERGINNMAASCSLMEALGKKSYFSQGSEKNLKITTVEDIEIFKALLKAKNDEWIK